MTEQHTILTTLLIRLRQRLLDPVRRVLRVVRVLPLRTAATVLAGGERRVAIGSGSVWIVDRIDRRVFEEVFVAVTYAGDYQGKHVLDLGAHKGYFGAYALVHGASTVVSYEPAEANFSRLQRAAETFPGWSVVRAAVGVETGEATLALSDESWAHRIGAGGEHSESVHVVGISDILGEAQQPLVVKMDVEGLESELVTAAGPDLWRRAERIYVEWHPFASCSFPDFRSRFEQMGFSAAPDVSGGVLRLTRSGAAGAVA